MARGLHVAPAILHRLARWLPLACLLCMPRPAVAVIYWAEATQGTVVDSTSGKPLEGVVVVAHWQLQGGMEGGSAVGQLQILETVTDPSGRYAFPGWGPKFALRGTLGVLAPRMLLFKRGYRYRGLDNTSPAGAGKATSDWNGKSVQLELFQGNLATYADHLNELSNSLWRVGQGTGEACGFERFPRMLRALADVEADLRAAGVRKDTVVAQLRANQSQLSAAGCRSLEAVLAP
jgi:hypothetical protein